MFLRNEKSWICTIVFPVFDKIIFVSVVAFIQVSVFLTRSKMLLREGDGRRERREGKGREGGGVEMNSCLIMRKGLDKDMLLGSNGLRRGEVFDGCRRQGIDGASIRIPQRWVHLRCYIRPTTKKDAC